MAMVQPKPRELVGRANPRLAPPLPAVSDLDGFRSTAESIGIKPMPWQEVSARYTEALAADGRHLYREVCEVASRQNGKTEKLVIVIVKRLRAGRRLMHTAQNRELPREVFERVADVMGEHHANLFPRRGGRVILPRFANGQESLRLTNGGRYKIVAPTRGGARGGTNDDVLVDELREMETWEFIAAAKPTMTVSPDPQIIYLSNAGDDNSAVLNSVRERANTDPNLAYIEWSASPERPDDDREGWREANPAIGHVPTMLEYLEAEYLSHKLGGTLAIFETEHLCRWVPTMRERLVDVEGDWAACEGSHDFRRNGYLAISVDPDRTRASGVLAWNDDERVKVRLLFDVTGNPIDLGRLGADVKAQAEELRVRQVGFDPLTDGELAKYFKNGVKITGQQFKVACSTFVNVVRGKQLSWSDSPQITADLMWTAKKEHDETGSFEAVRAKDERPITASLAAIRAVGLASGPQPVKPRVY